MRTERWILAGLAMAGCAALVLLAVASRSGRSDAEARGSTWSTEPLGARALFEFFERTEVPVGRVTHRDLPVTSGDVLFVLEPARLDPVGVDRLLERAGDGATVVVAGEVPALYGRLELGWHASSTRWRRHDDRPRELVPVFPGEIIDGVERVELRRRLRLSPGAGMIELLGDTGGTVLGVVPRDDGQVILLTDSFPLTNAGLSRGDHLRLAQNLAALRGSDGRIWFDEVHHGHRQARSPLTYLTEAGLAPALYLLALLGVVWLWHLRDRLGPPVPLRQPSRRTAAELVDSVAALLAATGSAVWPLRALYDQLRRDVARRTGVRPTASPEQLFRTLSRRQPRLAAALYAACRRVEDLLSDGTPPRDRDLLDAARGLAAARVELNARDSMAEQLT